MVGRSEVQGLVDLFPQEEYLSPFEEWAALCT